jgi:hypothetical protein
MLAISNIDLRDVRKRAAEIRNSWTAGERRRRMGLPPDMPSKVRDHLIGPRSITWTADART